MKVLRVFLACLIWALVVVLLLPPGADGQEYVRKVVVAETTFVPTPFPVALFQVIAPPLTPPPVTVSPNVVRQQEKALVDLRNAQQKQLEHRLERIENAIVLLVKTQQTKRHANAEDGPPWVATPVLSAGAATRNDTQNTRELSPDTRQARLQVAKRECAMCHTGDASRAGVQILNNDGQWEPSVSDREIYTAITRVGERRMPKGRAGLPPEEIALFNPQGE